MLQTLMNVKVVHGEWMKECVERGRGWMRSHFF